MSDAETTSDSPDQSLYSYVAKKVTVLQQRYHNDDSSATASLARLRRAVMSEPGADPSVWAETFEGMPPTLVGRGDAPSRHEVAAHTSITLFAVHQQSKRVPMHIAGIGFGSAVQKLAHDHSKGDNEKAVMRRFQALGTATDFEEVAYHARSLITQFRAEGVPLDYGRFAEDLADLQLPARADGVRLRWGREYYRIDRTATNNGGDNARTAAPAN